jgi:hypothetical protein
MIMNYKRQEESGCGLLQDATTSCRVEGLQGATEKFVAAGSTVELQTGYLSNMKQDFQPLKGDVHLLCRALDISENIYRNHRPNSIFLLAAHYRSTVASILTRMKTDETGHISDETALHALYTAAICHTLIPISTKHRHCFRRRKLLLESSPPPRSPGLSFHLVCYSNGLDG